MTNCKESTSVVTVPAKQTVTVKAHEFHRLITICGRCRDREGSRFTLFGVLMELDPAKALLTGVGTDGRQLATVRIDANWGRIDAMPDSTTSEVVDIQPLNKVRERLTSQKASEVTIAIYADHVMIGFDNGLHGKRQRRYDVKCPIIEDARFPNWRQVIPEPKTTISTAKINASQWANQWKEWVDNAKAYGLAINGETSVRLQPFPKLETEKHTGADIDVCLDFEYLMPHLALVNDWALLRYAGSECPLHVTSAGVDYLVMPRADKGGAA